MSNDLMEYPRLFKCRGCLRTLPEAKAIVRSLVSRCTDLLFPAEPFCGDECYRGYVSNPSSQFTEPSPERLREVGSLLTPRKGL